MGAATNVLADATASTEMVRSRLVLAIGFVVTVTREVRKRVGRRSDQGAKGIRDAERFRGVTLVTSPARPADSAPGVTRSADVGWNDRTCVSRAHIRGKNEKRAWREIHDDARTKTPRRVIIRRRANGE